MRDLISDMARLSYKGDKFMNSPEIKIPYNLATMIIKELTIMRDRTQYQVPRERIETNVTLPPKTYLEDQLSNIIEHTLYEYGNEADKNLSEIRGLKERYDRALRQAEDDRVRMIATVDSLSERNDKIESENLEIRNAFFLQKAKILKKKKARK